MKYIVVLANDEKLFINKNILNALSIPIKLYTIKDFKNTLLSKYKKNNHTIYLNQNIKTQLYFTDLNEINVNVFINYIKQFYTQK